MSQIIEVTVSPRGETHIETKGFTGGHCREASKALETALGCRRECGSQFARIDRLGLHDELR